MKRLNNKNIKIINLTGFLGVIDLEKFHLANLKFDCRKGFYFNFNP